MERFAEVAVPIPLRRTFSYRVPEEMRDDLVVGAQVEVPFGRRSHPGFVVGFTQDPDVETERIRPVTRITYPERVFDDAILGLARWVAEYYVASLGEVLMTALPGGLRSEPRRGRSPRSLEELGLATAPRRLTPAQEQVLGKISTALESPAGQTFLLYGVTGSGKTEVYVRATEEVLARGGQVLILVPEIALSYQVVDRFRLAFGERVGVFHSRMTARARQDTWRAARTGELGVIVGARSAVFTPLPHLQLIVLDEENDGAYKQSDSPRYHAREVAIMRANMNEAVVVLGTATPSLESFANAGRGKYELLRLPERIDARPRAEVVMKDLREEERPLIFGSALAQEMADRLHRQEQVILFLNRRGYAPFVQCRKCGWVARCDQCDVSLTYHRDLEAMVCHYCGQRRENVGECGNCGSLRLLFAGTGTQKVEDEIGGLFPSARVARLDFDSTRRAGSYSRILKAVGAGEVDILLGTQMVAKGLDFPRVTLVGVINADAGLNLPDFRSTERTFQILTQVAGRAGRGDRRGRVVLQTYYPEHYALTTAAAQDYDAFFRQEMAVRRELGYPPYSRMANLLFDGAREDRVTGAAEDMAEKLRAGHPPDALRFLGPAPQPLSRLKGKHRWHLAMLAPRHAQLQAACARGLADWEEGKRRFPGVRLSVDMDPIDLL